MLYGSAIEHINKSNSESNPIFIFTQDGTDLLTTLELCRVFVDESVVIELVILH